MKKRFFSFRSSDGYIDVDHIVEIANDPIKQTAMTVHDIISCLSWARNAAVHADLSLNHAREIHKWVERKKNSMNMTKTTSNDDLKQNLPAKCSEKIEIFIWDYLTSSGYDETNMHEEEVGYIAMFHEKQVKWMNNPLVLFQKAMGCQQNDKFLKWRQKFVDKFNRDHCVFGKEEVDDLIPEEGDAEEEPKKKEMMKDEDEEIEGERVKSKIRTPYVANNEVIDVDEDEDSERKALFPKSDEFEVKLKSVGVPEDHELCEDEDLSNDQE